MRIHVVLLASSQIIRSSTPASLNVSGSGQATRHRLVIVCHRAIIGDTARKFKLLQTYELKSR